MQTIQLYIQGTRADMFNDESVSITQTIKNVRDIEKVFTSFTRQFTLPASKTNNKLFEHYYNYGIVDGFDARRKVDANIELNHNPYREGKLKLDGVEMRDNKPYAYKVTFYGNTVNIKDLIGDDKLSDLDFGTDFNNLKYDAATIETNLDTTNPATTTVDLITPLITHSQLVYYDSTSGHENDPGAENNMYYDAGTGHKHGVFWNELKYAMRLNRIIEAIEDTYSITFSTDFFKNTSNTRFYNLWMWLHRKKGAVETETGDGTNLVSTFTQSLGVDPYFAMTNNTLYAYLDPIQLTSMSLDINIAAGDSAKLYKIRITRNDINIYESATISGNQTITAGTDFTYEYGSYKVYLITDETSIQVTDVDWDITYASTTLNFTTPSSFTITNELYFIISQQIPKMGVLEFLTALFKMFNLVAEVETDGTIYVDTLDNYYTDKRSSSDPYNITKYIDIENGQVNSALPFSEVDYFYRDTNTVLAKKYDQIVNKPWGGVEYKDDQTPVSNFSGGTYSVEVPFHHAQFERLTDLNTGNFTEIVCGKFVDDNLDSYFGSPLVFYAVRHNIPLGYSFVDALNADGEPTSHKNNTYANIPLNTVALYQTTSDDSIHFTEEIGEYDTTKLFAGSLFEDYHKTYIQNVFNPKNRITKVTVYLPLRVLMNFTLADRFQIVDRIYKINSIQTNLLTGKSEIELIND